MVSITRRKLNFKKVGHTGTLDPMAAGVLPVCIGKATKIIEYIQADQKTYRAELTIGQETDTQDRWGTVLNEKPIPVIKEQVIDVLKSFEGEIFQIPPMYSALKVKGQKLYDLARQGIVIEREPRKRMIYSIKPIRIEENRVLFDVTCAKGTYIRTLCHDIGLKLGSFGHMSFLLRTETGCFNLNNGITVEAFQEASKEHILSQIIQPLDVPFSHLKSVDLPIWVGQKVMNGQFVEFESYLKESVVPNEMLRFYSGEAFLL